jgi:RNA polymerase sigma-70 factor (ECF subfamily)
MTWTILSPDEQATVVQGIREGDPAAEEAFVRLFGERVGVMMLVRTRDRETARDLTQDVMLAAWRAIRNGQLRHPERLAPFVLGIARNVANNHMRVRAAEPSLEPLNEATESIAAPDQESAATRALVAAALRHLGPADRRVLVLTLVHGLNPRDIAARLGLGAEVVRARKSRALKRIIDIVERMSRIVPERH